MKIWHNFFALACMLFLAACGSDSTSPIIPAPDRPTFLYFYTDG